jgi:hypothetical protein
MLSELRALWDGKPRPLALESFRVEHGLEPFWMGRPARGPYLMHAGAAMLCGLLAVVLYLRDTTSGWVVPLAGLLVATLYPLIASRDWYATEYLLTPDLIVINPGAFSSGIRIHDLAACDGVEEETPRLARRLRYRHLHLVTAPEEGEPKVVASLRHVPDDVASSFLDVLDMLDNPPETVISAPSRPPESESSKVTP